MERRKRNTVLLEVNTVFQGVGLADLAGSEFRHFEGGAWRRREVSGEERSAR